MLNESLLSAVRDALAALTTWRAERLPPEQAQESFQALKARHPDHWMNRVWEQEAYGDTVHYDILLADEEGTYSLSYCADEDVPWPARGLQRVNESLVLRVNDDPVLINQVITSLDHAWSSLHIGRHLINMSLIDQALRDSDLEVTDEELAEALLDFRRRRRLFTVEQVERWMVEHGTTQVRLEQQLREEVAKQKLRLRVAASRCGGEERDAPLGSSRGGERGACGRGEAGAEKAEDAASRLGTAAAPDFRGGRVRLRQVWRQVPGVSGRDSTRRGAREFGAPGTAHGRCAPDPGASATPRRRGC